jgi:hypothetical protein
MLDCPFHKVNVVGAFRWHDIGFIQVQLNGHNVDSLR